MLSRENYTMENIMELKKKYKKDPGLLERVMYAFGLLEALSMVEMPFIFKGGTCLMLLTEHPRRLSTDIDIIVEPGTDIDYYIAEASKLFPFKRVEEQIRIGKNKIEKRHFKFIYDSPMKGAEFYILLDAVFTENIYEAVVEKEIKNELLIVENEPIVVTVPSADCILGDKLTAFAPHTTGIPFGIDKELEIMKQMYDVVTLSDVLQNQKEMEITYKRTALEEIAYRGINATPEDVLRDTIRSAACIIGKGDSDAEEYPLYLSGAKSLDNHVLGGRYSGEIAALQACKAMYLAACVLTGSRFKKIAHPEEYIDANIGKTKYKKLSYIKKYKLESYGYLVEAVQLLEG